MVCIYCSSETRVTNSRHQKKQNNVWRRRHCTQCGANFTTLEKADLLTSLSVSHNKHLEPFSRDKLLFSIYDSLKHRKTAVGDATALSDTIIAKTRSLITNGTLDRNALVASSTEVLKRFDKAAASYYSAYHPL